MNALRARDVPGMGGVLADIFGKPQSWYDALNQLQVNLASVMAGVTAIGQELWDTVWRSFAGAPSGSPTFDSYSYVTSSLDQDLKNVLVTKDHAPTDGDIQLAQNDWTTFAQELNYAKSVMPEIAINVDQAVSQAADATSKSPMKAPAVVGEQVFWKTIADRAMNFGQGLLDFGLGIGKYAAWGLVAILGIWAVSKFGGSSHER